MGHEDVEAVDDLCHGNGLILLPILNILSAVNKDDEVVVLALVVDLGLSGMSTRSVTPPTAAAFVADSNPSHSVRPGSLT